MTHFLYFILTKMYTGIEHALIQFNYILFSDSDLLQSYADTESSSVMEGFINGLVPNHNYKQICCLESQSLNTIINLTVVEADLGCFNNCNKSLVISNSSGDEVLVLGPDHNETNTSVTVNGMVRIVFEQTQEDSAGNKAIFSIGFKGTRHSYGI